MEVSFGLERIQNVDSKEPDGVKNGHDQPVAKVSPVGGLSGERKILSFMNWVEFQNWVIQIRIFRRNLGD